MGQYDHIKTVLAAYHKPHLISSPEGGDGAHVCEIWEDGEVTLTKAGSLYGLRSLHMIAPPLSAALPLDVMPRLNRRGLHGTVVVRFDERKCVRSAIAEALGVEDMWCEL